MDGYSHVRSIRTVHVRLWNLRRKCALVLILLTGVSDGAEPLIYRLPVNAQSAEITLQPIQRPARVARTPEIPANGDSVEESLSVHRLLADVNPQQLEQEASASPEVWWSKQVETSLRDAPAAYAASVDQLIQLAMRNSAQLFVYSKVPEIRETSITEADAAFDWTTFVDGLWEDTNDPVGNTLTVGGTTDRFKDNNLNVTGGVRRKTLQGANLEISQRLGHQSNNSTFFIPNDQGTARLTLSFTQPLMRGRGSIYNTSLTVLAQIDTKVARDEFERQLETHLLEVVRAYWAVYLERGSLAQKVNLYARTKQIADQLERRKHIDAQMTQLVSARAALAERTSDLVRTQAAVKNAETRLRGLVNSPELGEAGQIEIIPAERPTSTLVPFELATAVETAVQNRSEIQQAMKQIKAGAIRFNMAKHEMLPVLNAVTQVYVSGLRGDSDIGKSWVDQFGRGGPSYTAGLQFEVPIWRRATSARLKRRRIEMEQLQGQYRNSLETVKNEVEIAVREVHTAYEEMMAKYLAMQAVRRETEALENRWRQLANVDTSGALALESLLRAQERTSAAEFDFLSSQLTYNLALMHIKRAMGVLVQLNLDLGGA